MPNKKINVTIWELNLNRITERFGVVAINSYEARYWCPGPDKHQDKTSVHFYSIC